jgi:iron(III) transport system substrate-binding protein
MKNCLFRVGVALGSAALLASGLSGCQSKPMSPKTSGSGTIAPERTVNVYSARHYDSDAALFKKFSAQSGIKINVVEGQDDELIERIKTEGVNSPADVFITVDAGRLWRAEQKQLFQAVDSKVLEQRIPANLRHPKGYWFGLTKRARAIAYSKDKVQPSQLSTYEALAAPQWKGKVCVRSSNNVYNQSLLGSMIESKGAAATEVWAKGLVQNFARPPQGGDIDQIKAIAVGECEVGLVNHYYYLRMQEGKNPKNRELAAKVNLFFPNQGDRGTHINISGAGVVANAPHRAAAIEFLEFLTTSEAQKDFAQGNDEYPVVADAPLPPPLKGFGKFKTDVVNVSAYGRNSPEAVKIADRAGWK